MKEKEVVVSYDVTTSQGIQIYNASKNIVGILKAIDKVKSNLLVERSTYPSSDTSPKKEKDEIIKKNLEAEYENKFRKEFLKIYTQIFAEHGITV
jgi:hypothetical protein